MSSVNYLIIGAPKPSPAPADGSVPVRLELRVLQQSADQWNLYLLGLDAFKKTDESSDLSYYGVCGIHGMLFLSGSPFAPHIWAKTHDCLLNKTSLGVAIWIEHAPYEAATSNLTSSTGY
jgi:hypothetical protein